MTNPKDSCTETTPISVSSDDSLNKDHKINEDMDQRRHKREADSTLSLQSSESRGSVSVDVPRPQQSVGAVRTKNTTLTQEEPGTEPSQGTDNGDDEDVISLNEALSRLDVKGEDGAEVLSYCSFGTEALNRAPETTSLGSSVDPESDECGSKGSGNVSGDESDIDSDGVSSMSDSSLPQDNREHLVERGPTRHRTSQPRHQGKPYDRQPASHYVVTREQDDDLMNLVRSSSNGSTLPQQPSPQGSLDQTYVDARLDDISNDPSQNASQISEVDDAYLEDIFALLDPAHTSGQAAEAARRSSSDHAEPNIIPSSSLARCPNTDAPGLLTCSPAHIQSTIPTVVKDKMNEQETHQTKKRTPKKRKDIPTKRKQKDTRMPRKQNATASPSLDSTRSECRTTAEQSSDQQQTAANVQSRSSQGLGFQASAMLEDAMSYIDDDLRRETENGTSFAQIPPEVSRSLSHGPGTQTSHAQMPLYPAQPVHQFPMQNYTPPVALLSPRPQQTTPLLPPVQPSVPFQVPVIIPAHDVTPLAVQSISQQHIVLDSQGLHQQPELPSPTSTQALSYGTAQLQQITSQPTMIPNVGLRYLLPSSAQHKLTTAGTLGATSCQIFAFPFQPVRPVAVRSQLATQTRPNISDISRFPKIVPKPT
ncbi:uncharacterized protein [Haliotis asinina]